jgi:[ribosomal protein S5]-alanine N-acetyltransferase
LKHVGTQTIETERLILRKYKITDAEDMFHNWVTDPEVSRFWSWKPHKDIAETKLLLSDWINEYSNLNIYHWVIVLKNTSQAIGYIYLNEINDADQSVSVHYLLSRTLWNQGIITEACRSVIEFAFIILGVDKVHTRHHIDNPASGKVLRKCGMQYIQTKYKHFPDCEQISGNYCFYEITKQIHKINYTD